MHARIRGALHRGTVRTLDQEIIQSKKNLLTVNSTCDQSDEFVESNSNAHRFTTRFSELLTRCVVRLGSDTGYPPIIERKYHVRDSKLFREGRDTCIWGRIWLSTTEHHLVTFIVL